MIPSYKKKIIPMQHLFGNNKFSLLPWSETSLIFILYFLYTQKTFLWIKQIYALLYGQRKVSLIWRNFLIVFFFEFKKWMSAQSHKHMSNVMNRNIFFNLKKKLSSFKVIKLNKLFLKFLLVLYLNQINSVNKIISFI